MRDMKHITIFGKYDRFKFKFTSIPIEKNFERYDEAALVRDAVVKNLAQLKTLRHELSPRCTFKKPLPIDDWLVIKNTNFVMHQFVLDVICPQKLVDDRRTVAQVMQKYLDFRASDSVENRHGEITESVRLRYTHWRDNAKIRHTLWEDVEMDDVKAERTRLINIRQLGTSAANSYCNSLSASHKLEYNTSFLPVPLKKNIKRGEGAHTEPYTEAEAVARIEMADVSDAYGREHNLVNSKSPAFVYLGVMLRVYKETGMRKTSVQMLRRDEIDYDRGFILKQTKGGKPSKIPLNDYVMEVLRAQEAIVALDYGVACEWLFPAVDGSEPNDGWYSKYRRLLKANGLMKGAPYKCLHSFRAHAASELAKAGAAINHIADQLQCGHGIASGYAGDHDAKYDEVKRLGNARSRTLPAVPSRVVTGNVVSIR